MREKYLEKIPNLRRILVEEWYLIHQTLRASRSCFLEEVESNIFTWSFNAFAYDLNNPPTMQSSCDVTLSLINQVNVLQISKKPNGSQTKYEVVVQNPNAIGILSNEQTIINRASQDLVLAFDLLLERVVLSVFRLEPTKPDVIMSSSPAEVVVKDTATGKSVEIHETLTLRAEVHITVGTSENLDEARTVGLSKKLIKLQRFALDSISAIQRANLINGLHEYEAAMASLDHLLIFKHLYSVLGLVTNMGSMDRSGTDLDVNMSQVTGTLADKCKDWRELNNRTKHIHRTSADVATLVSGTEKVTEYIPVMRLSAAKALTSILESI